MSNAERILDALDAALDQQVELTLYGRAAFQLGWASPPSDVYSSLDVDVVLWLGQAEDLLQVGNFWDAVHQVNHLLEAEGLYISHFFEEDQVVLRPDWRTHRVPLEGDWKNLVLYRLADEDLFLSKLMRDEPLDRADAAFIVQHRGWGPEEIQRVIAQARVPPIAEVQEQFERCSRRFLNP
jgi:hypothetical protein